jgi:glucan phosphoethanolaminetransferase (alkaline phosphatase superfamily)
MSKTAALPPPANAKAMAQPNGKKGKAAKGRKRKKISLTGVILMIAFLVTAMVFYPTTIILVAGMVPTLVAFMTDDQPQRLGPITVGCLNFCGVCAILMQLWMVEHSFNYAMELITAPLNWLIMYAAAALGWGVWYAIPALYAGASVAAARSRLESLRKSREELLQEWGADLNRIEAERRELHEMEKLAKDTKRQAARAAAGAAAAAANAR